MQVSLATVFSLSYFLQVVEKLLLFIWFIYMDYVCFNSVSYVSILPPTSCFTPEPLIHVCMHGDIMEVSWWPRGNEHFQGL